MLAEQFNVIQERFSQVETIEPLTNTVESWNFSLEPFNYVQDDNLFANCGDNRAADARRRYIDVNEYPRTINFFICQVCKPGGGGGGCTIGFVTNFPNGNSERCVKSSTSLIGCDAVALDVGVLPNGGSQLGMTAVHELGHYFGIYHVFQSSSTCAGEGDLIDDTPYASAPNYGCPINSDTCPSQPGLDAIRFVYFINIK